MARSPIPNPTAPDNSSQPQPALGSPGTATNQTPQHRQGDGQTQPIDAHSSKAARCTRRAHTAYGPTHTRDKRQPHGRQAAAYAGNATAAVATALHF